VIVRIQKNDLNKDNIFLGKEKGESAIVEIRSFFLTCDPKKERSSDYKLRSISLVS